MLFRSGNYSTSSRIADHVEACGHHPKLLSPVEAKEMMRASTTYQLVIAIHAYRSACLIGSLPHHCRLVLIFGGTDLNEASKDEEKNSAMKLMVTRSSKCIAFSGHLADGARRLWPELGDRIVTIHQSVTTQPSSEFKLADYLERDNGFCVRSRLIALLIAGVRPVKDPLYLCDAFADAALGASMVLVIIGPLLDHEYGCSFLKEVDRRSNVVYAGSLSLQETHASITQCFCLVNSSISEGMSAAILEAFSLETVVIARTNPGNSYLIQNGINGLLYESITEFTSGMQLLIEDSGRKQVLIDNAKNKIASSFSHERERDSYKQLLNSVIYK